MQANNLLPHFAHTAASQPGTVPAAGQATGANGLHLQIVPADGPRAAPPSGDAPALALAIRARAAHPGEPPRLGVQAAGAQTIFHLPPRDPVAECTQACADAEAVLQRPDRSIASKMLFVTISIQKATSAARSLSQPEADGCSESIVRLLASALKVGGVSPSSVSQVRRCLARLPQPRAEALWQQVRGAQGQRLRALASRDNKLPIGPGDYETLQSFTDLAARHPSPGRTVQALIQAARIICRRRPAGEIAVDLLTAIQKSPDIVETPPTLQLIGQICNLVTSINCPDAALDFYETLGRQAAKFYPGVEEITCIMRHAAMYLNRWCEGEDGEKFLEKFARLTFLLDPGAPGDFYISEELTQLRAKLRTQISERLISEIMRNAEVTRQDARERAAGAFPASERAKHLASYQQCRVVQAIAWNSPLVPHIAHIAAEYAERGYTFPVKFNSGINLIPRYRGAMDQLPRTGKRVRQPIERALRTAGAGSSASTSSSSSSSSSGSISSSSSSGSSSGIAASHGGTVVLHMRPDAPQSTALQSGHAAHQDDERPPKRHAG